MTAKKEGASEPRHQTRQRQSAAQGDLPGTGRENGTGIRHKNTEASNNGSAKTGERGWCDAGENFNKNHGEDSTQDHAKLDGHLLPALVESGKMDLESVGRLYDDMKTKKEIQAIHRYSITAPKNPGARWMTKIREGGQLKKVVATTERGLYKKLALYYHDRSRTMETLLGEWLERRKSTNVDFRTIAINVNHWDKYYAGHDLVKKPLQDITVFDLEDFFHEQIKKHSLTVKSLNNMKIIAKDMLHMSKRKGYINENPFHDIEINKESCQPPNKANDVSRIYLPDERERFFKAISEEMQENPSNTDCHAIMLLFKFGLRIGELTALRWGDIDRRADELQIRRMETVIEEDGKTYREVVPYTKKRSEYGFREMPLTGYEYGIFEAVKEVNRASGYKDGDYIFCDSDGRRKNREIDCKIRKLCKAAAIVPAKSAHDIRRTVATQMYQDGVPISEIQRFLGHSDEKTTWGYIVDFDGKARHRSLITNSLNIFSVPLCTQFAEKAKTPETA